MGKTVIITDSGCDIPKDKLNDNIRVLPYTICIGETDYLKEDVINKRIFSQNIKAGFRPTGVGIERQSVLDVLNSLDEETDEIIFITSSSMMYPSNEVIIKDAVIEYFASHISSRIAIIDSNTTSMALGFLVLDAAKMAEMKHDFEDIVRYVKTNKSRYRMDLVANDITILNEQKIISSRKAKLVESHKKNYLVSMSRFGLLMPIIGRDDDAKVKKIMIDRLLDNCAEYYAIVSSYLNHEGSYFAEYISEYGDFEPITSRFGISNTTFVGTNTISLCYKKKK